jgi:predicted DNA-binding protein
VLYDRVRDISRESGRPATTMVREAIEEWVVRTEKMRIRDEIAAYAAAEAGGEHDLDPDLEQASAEEFEKEQEE